MVRIRVVFVALALLSCVSSSKSSYDPDQSVEMRASDFSNDFSKEGDLLTPDDSMRPTDTEERGIGGSGLDDAPHTKDKHDAGR
ncbi:MAG: hypothetical protein ACT4TC_05220 [Myxococcaceae bacterium]